MTRFKGKPAIDPATNLLVKDGSGQVYAVTDTAFASPLEVTDTAGLPLATISTGPLGIHQDFDTVADHLEVVWKSGPYTVTLESSEGIAAAAAASAAQPAADAAAITVRDELSSTFATQANLSTAVLGEPAEVTDTALIGILDLPNGNTRKRLPELVNVKGYGAKGDGVTDDSAAILAAYADAAASARPVNWPPGSYRMTQTITPAAGVETYMASGAHILYAGSGIAVNLDGWSGSPGGNLMGRSTFSVVRELAQWAGGIDTSSVGIRFNRVNSCHFEVREVANFHTGLLMTAEGTGSSGTCYNTFDLGEIRDNKRNIQYSTGPDGWVNSNTYRGGTVRHNGGFASYVGTVGWASVDATAGSYNNGNNDTFLNVCFEGGFTETVVDVRGAFTTFVGGSWEANQPGAVKINASATGALFLGGYGNQGPKTAIFDNQGKQSVILGIRGMSSYSDSSAGTPQGGGAAAYEATSTFGGNDLLFRGTNHVGVRRWTLDAAGRSKHWSAGSGDAYPTVQLDGSLVTTPGGGPNYYGALSFGRGNAEPDATLARTTGGVPGIVSGVPILGRTLRQTHAAAGALALVTTKAEVAVVTLGANVTSLDLSDGVNDADHTQTLTLMLVQDATGGRTVTAAPKVAFAGGTVPALTATGGKRDVFTLVWDSAVTKWIETGRTLNV